MKKSMSQLPILGIGLYLIWSISSLGLLFDNSIYGWINELFKDGVAGKNLKFSLLHIVNKIKEENHIPDFVRLADVSTIYKGKGSKKKTKKGLPHISHS